MQLPENHIPGNQTAFFRVVGVPVLFPAQKHIPAALSAYTRQKFPAGLTKRQPNSPFRTSPHQSRRRAGIGECNDAVQRMQRIPGQHLLLPFGYYILPVQSKINIL